MSKVRVGPCTSPHPLGSPQTRGPTVGRKERPSGGLLQGSVESHHTMIMAPALMRLSASDMQVSEDGCAAASATKPARAAAFIVECILLCCAV